METAEEEIVETILEEAGRLLVNVCLSICRFRCEAEAVTVVTFSRYLCKQRYTATPCLHKHTHTLSLAVYDC